VRLRSYHKTSTHLTCPAHYPGIWGNAVSIISIIVVQITIIIDIAEIVVIIRIGRTQPLHPNRSQTNG